MKKKNEILQDIMNEFRKYGYEGTSLSLISKKTHLGKASLYHHFPNGKEEMALLIIENINQDLKIKFSALFELKQEPDALLGTFLKYLSEFYDHGRTPCLIDVFSMDSAPKNVTDKVKVTFDELLNYFKKIFDRFHFDEEESIKKSKNALCLIQGSLILTRLLGDVSYFEKAVEQIKNLQI